MPRSYSQNQLEHLCYTFLRIESLSTVSMQYSSYLYKIIQCFGSFPYVIVIYGLGRLMRVHLTI